MSFKSTCRQVGEVTVLDLEGRMVLGGGSGDFRDSIRKLMADGKDKILINLAEVSYIDSSGLGELVAAYVSITNARGQVKLENMQNKIQDLLQLTKLNSVFETFTDEARALRSFRASAATA